MIQVQYMKPFYTKVKGDKLRLVFAYQYLSITKEDEIFHFIPIEGKEMIINIKTSQIENSNEVFVFQKGNRFIRLPLYLLWLISDVQAHIAPIIKSNSPSREHTELTWEEAEELITTLEQENLNRLVNQALLDNNKELFFELLQHRKGDKYEST